MLLIFYGFIKTRIPQETGHMTRKLG